MTIDHLTLTFQHQAPKQWEDFCERYPDQRKCTFPGEAIYLTGRQAQVMIAIQRYVNQSFAYLKEDKDKWSLMGFVDAYPQGDCEDFALTKRALLHAAGFRLGALWPAWVTWNKDGKTMHHMVLVVHTTSLDYVLDVGDSGCTPLYDSSIEKYTWLAVYDGDVWRIVTPNRLKAKEEGA